MKERKITESLSLSAVTVAVNNVLVNTFEKQLCKVVKVSFYHGVFFLQFVIKYIKYEPYQSFSEILFKTIFL